MCAFPISSQLGIEMSHSGLQLTHICACPGIAYGLGFPLPCTSAVGGLVGETGVQLCLSLVGKSGW